MANDLTPAREQRSLFDRIGRRGIFTGLVGIGAVVLSRFGAPRKVEAAHNGSDDQTVLHADVTNTTSGSTRISSDISGTAAFVALNDYPVGISRPDGMLGRTSYTTSNCAGVAGASQASSGGIGVLGAALASNGCGVYGFAGSVVPSTVAPAGSGVYGASGSGAGVHGRSTGSTEGVRGISSNGTGMYGSGGGGGHGVVGDAPNGAGLVGYGNSNYGGVAISNTGTALLGQANAGGIGVVGTSVSSHGMYGQGGGSGHGVVGLSSLGAGIFGQALSGTALAGQFFGDVSIQGKLFVNGVQVFDSGGGQSVARLSPSLIEDIGEAKLSQGKAEVKLDQAFTDQIQGARYQVFLTAQGDSRGLYVANKTSSGFEVREQQGGVSSLAFDYRVVSRGPTNRRTTERTVGSGGASAPGTIKPIDPKDFPRPFPKKDLPDRSKDD